MLSPPEGLEIPPKFTAGGLYIWGDLSFYYAMHMYIYVWCTTAACVQATAVSHSGAAPAGGTDAGARRGACQRPVRGRSRGVRRRLPGRRGAPPGPRALQLHRAGPCVLAKPLPVSSLSLEAKRQWPSCRPPSHSTAKRHIHFFFWARPLRCSAVPTRCWPASPPPCGATRHMGGIGTPSAVLPAPPVPCPLRPDGAEEPPAADDAQPPQVGHPGVLAAGEDCADVPQAGGPLQGAGAPGEGGRGRELPAGAEHLSRRRLGSHRCSEEGEKFTTYFVLISAISCSAK